jgi:hypothetical protein
MYPSKGRSGNGTLSFAFDTHDAAAAREKRQEINVTLPGFAWFILLHNFLPNTGFHQQNVGLQYSYVIGCNPVDILTYMMSWR